MGLFSSKKKVYVSSVVYNLAGDELTRPNYMKTTIIGTMMSPTGDSLGEGINKAYLGGPGIRLRSFARWCRTSGYNTTIGLTPSTLTLANKVNEEALANLIPHGPEETVQIQSAEIGLADYADWVDQYMYANFPDRISENWVADFNENTNEVTITFPDNTTNSFVITDFDQLARYLVVSYNIASGAKQGPLVTGSVVPLGSSGSFPSTTGWDNVSLSEVSVPVTLDTIVHTVVSYSDGRPDEESDDTTTINSSYMQINNVWERSDLNGTSSNSAAIMSLYKIMYLNQTGSVISTPTTTAVEEDIGGGVTKTTTTTTITESVLLDRSYRIDEQENIVKEWSDMTVLIYKENSGNPGYDALFNITGSFGAFVPYIPFRLDNQFISTNYHPDVYPMAKKAFKKAIGGKYDKVMTDIGNNPSIGDIDYAYAAFGVSLNVRENACRRYIYEFFKEILLGTGPTAASLSVFRDAWHAAEQSYTDWYSWYLAMGNYQWGGGGFGWENPGPEPEILPYPSLPTFSVQVASGNRPSMNYNMVVSWNGLEESTGTGLKKPGAKTGELWFEIVGTEVFNRKVQSGDDSGQPYMYLFPQYRIEHVRLHWQETANSWRTLDLYGLHHRNLIYDGKSVDTTGIDALNDGEESGFIIPLHENIYRTMPLVASTQMSTACTFMVFNSYEVVKQKWYQSGIFKIFMIVVIIVVSIYTGGAGAGLLGSAASVGASLGFAGMTAVIVGAIANAIAAMIIMSIIQAGATALFGEKLGAIIGAIAAIVAVSVGTSLANGGTISSGFSALTKADNILKLTNAAGQGYSGYIQAATQEIVGKTEALMSNYNEQAKQFKDMYESTFGGSLGVLDPLDIANVGSMQNLSYENMDMFLSRTLLTGSEVAQMSMDLLNNFAGLTLSTALP